MNKHLNSSDIHLIKHPQDAPKQAPIHRRPNLHELNDLLPNITGQRQRSSFSIPFWQLKGDSEWFKADGFDGKAKKRF